MDVDVNDGGFDQWQGVVIALLVKEGWIRDLGEGGGNTSLARF